LESLFLEEKVFPNPKRTKGGALHRDIIFFHTHFYGFGSLNNSLKANL